MPTNNNGYTRFVGTNGSSQDEFNLVNQSSPSWILTFVRWDIRDTFRTPNQGNSTSSSVRNPLVVQNDCVQLSVTTNKGTLTPNMSATLVQTDIDYETAVAPGDFVFVNMLDWDKDADRVAQQASNLQPINGQNDGFKGIFKVQSVRKLLQTDPSTGIKTVLFNISGFAFTEFNNVIYYNQYLVDKDVQAAKLWISNFAAQFAAQVNKKGYSQLEDILRAYIDGFIGEGISNNSGATQTKTGTNYNTNFYIPQKVGQLLNVSGAKAAKDIYNYLFGVQRYSNNPSQSLPDGMNPSGVTNNISRYYSTPDRCQGLIVLEAQYWNQVKLWSILNQYTNSPLNELYTCFRISPDGDVMPTLVFRQIPFTSEDFPGGNLTTTKFMNLPRWKISPALVFNVDVGRDEAARVNFVQYFGRTIVDDNGWQISEEVGQGNYSYDPSDVSRSGLRPYVVTTQFDQLGGNKTTFQAVDWAKILGDSLIGGHMKMNGSLECVGIVDPIAVGDNLDFDGVIYHIEQVTHTCFVSPGSDGRAIKSFRTILSLSSGVSKLSSASGTAYSEMRYPNAYAYRQNDYKNNKLVPGVSESQTSPSRGTNPEPNIQQEIGSNQSFVQPQTVGPVPSDNTEDT